jgi:hypothetical protein
MGVDCICTESDSFSFGHLVQRLLVQSGVSILKEANQQAFWKRVNTFVRVNQKISRERKEKVDSISSILQRAQSFHGVSDVVAGKVMDRLIDKDVDLSVERDVIEAAVKEAEKLSGGGGGGLAKEPPSPSGEDSKRDLTFDNASVMGIRRKRKMMSQLLLLLVELVCLVGRRVWIRSI